MGPVRGLWWAPVLSKEMTRTGPGDRSGEPEKLGGD